MKQIKIRFSSVETISLLQGLYLSFLYKEKSTSMNHSFVSYIHVMMRRRAKLPDWKSDCSSLLSWSSEVQTYQRLGRPSKHKALDKVSKLASMLTASNFDLATKPLSLASSESPLSGEKVKPVPKARLPIRCEKHRSSLFEPFFCQPFPYSTRRDMRDSCGCSLAWIEIGRREADEVEKRADMMRSETWADSENSPLLSWSFPLSLVMAFEQRR